MPASRLAGARIPRVIFEARRQTPAVQPLRTDIAGAILWCSRGPLARPVDQQREDVPLRIEGWREFERVFGGFEGDALSAFAVKGYFDNGGEVLWVVRVARGGATAKTAAPKDVLGLFGAKPGGQVQVFASELHFEASSPGRWGNGMRIRLRYRHGGTPAGQDLGDLRVIRNGAIVEQLLAINPLRMVDEVNQLSSYVRVSIASAAAAAGDPPGREVEFSVELQGGDDQPPGEEEYSRAARALASEPEPAILFAPDVWRHLRPKSTDPADPVYGFYREWAAAAAAGIDRIVLVDPPCRPSGMTLREQAAAIRNAPFFEARGPRDPAAAALYYPRLCVPEPAPVANRATRVIPASGHVAGVISRMDRERGAHHTPANTDIVGAVDLDRDYDEAEWAVLHQEGLNALRCARGRGVEVWGGRTLDLERQRRFLAHRRLIHRLVRAIRLVADPLVFESNTPALRFALVRAITTVLLEAFRAGALKGSRPEEAFRVACNDETNPPDAYDTGHCIAEVSLAPATPMEFITLTVTLTENQSLEVIE